MSRTGRVSIRDKLVKKRIAFRLPTVYGIPKPANWGLGVESPPFFPPAAFSRRYLFIICSLFSIFDQSFHANFPPTNMSKDEEVLVVPASLLLELGPFSGFQPAVDRYLPVLLDRSHQSFRPRSIVENDPSFKQLIPYVILECNDEEQTRLFRYTRGKGQGEKRLHALQSIGIGGHISIEDAQGDDWYRNGMQRELSEEVIIECGGKDQIVGLIYDDTTEVGRVHLGIVHVMQLSSCKATPQEDHLLEAGFLPIEEIRQQIGQMETWSQLCLKNLY